MKIFLQKKSFCLNKVKCIVQKIKMKLLNSNLAISLIAVFFLCFAANLHGQQTPFPPPNQLQVYGIQELNFGSFSTGASGGTVIISPEGFRSSTGSVILMGGNFNQAIFEVGWNFFFAEEKWFSQSNIKFSRFPDWFYGVGENSLQSDQVTYNSTRAEVEISFLRNLGQKNFSGPAIRWLSYQNINYMEGDNGTFLQLQPSAIYGLGGIFTKDKRNNLLTPTKGNYTSVGLTYNTGDAHEYLKLTADQRYYYTFLKHTTLAARALAEINFGQAPFYDLAFLGGDAIARGYYFGRFRDNGLTGVQAELRQLLFWRIGATVFGGVSKLYNSFNTVDMKNLKPNAGLGLRFLVDKKQKVNLRFDFAWGQAGQTGFYVAFGESF